MKVYLIELTGQGDEQACVVKKETFNWLNSPYPEELEGYSGGEDPNTPESQNGDVFVTAGSCTNDRALAVISDIRGYNDIYFTIQDAHADIFANNDTLVATSYGFIY